MSTCETNEHTNPDTESTIAAESSYLTAARAALRRMRERAAELKKSDVTGDWVSGEYLDSTYALRMQQLADDPTTPLFFGRLDYAPGRSPDENAPGPSRYYIGRRHVGDADGEPLVVDWRGRS